MGQAQAKRPNDDLRANIGSKISVVALSLPLFPPNLPNVIEGGIDA